ncbi:hypothetical protein CCMA1212_009674 [Trichoderma ghanense]|uniref:SSCRP protein n=1 Tax=Trichoderma ghanense TaxID=65468 RepID=A0ABY2GSE2_9HYPO
MTSLSPGSSNAHKETILVLCCLGGGIFIATLLAVAIMMSKGRARRRRLQDKECQDGGYGCLGGGSVMDEICR